MGQKTGTVFPTRASLIASLPLKAPMFDGAGAADLGNLTKPWRDVLESGLVPNTVVSVTGQVLTVAAGTAQFKAGTVSISSGLTAVTAALSLPITPATDIITASLLTPNPAQGKGSDQPIGVVVFSSSISSSAASFFYLIVGTK